MSSNELPPLGSQSNLPAPENRVEKSIHSITTRLTGINQKIEDLNRNTKGGFGGVVTKLQEAYYGIQKTWLTYRLNTLSGKVSAPKSTPTQEKTERVSDSVLHPESEIESYDTEDADESYNPFDDFKLPTYEEVQSSAPTRLEALKEKLGKTLTLTERLVIRNELKKMPEAQGLLAEQQKIIDKLIVDKYEKLKANPNIDKAIKALSPEERQEMINNSAKCNDAVINKKIDVVRHELAAQDLVDKLKKDETLQLKDGSSVPLRDALVTRSKSVISTAALFDRIFLELVNATSGEKEILLNFAVDWVKRNRASEEFPKAKNALENILELGALPEGPREALQNAFSAEPVAKPAVEFDETTKLRAPLKGVLEAVRKNLLDPSSNEYDFILQDIADDLSRISNANYLHLTADDLATNKWKETPAAARNITEFSTALTRFVQYTILSSNEPEVQKRYANLFIDLAEKCLEDGNIEAVTAISVALNGFQFVDKNNEKLVRINQLLSSDKNYKLLHAFYDNQATKGNNTVPFVGQFQSQITFSEDGNPAIQNDRSNLSKLALIQDIENRLLRFQNNSEQGTALTTDIYSQIQATRLIDADDLEMRRLDLNLRAALSKLSSKERKQYEALLAETATSGTVSKNVKEAIDILSKLLRTMQTQKADKEFAHLRSILQQLGADMQSQPVELQRFLAATGRGAAQGYFPALQKVATGDIKQLLDASEMGALLALEARFKKINGIISGETNEQG